MQAMLRHLDFKPLKCVVVASPGFVRDAFLEYVWAQVLVALTGSIIEACPYPPLPRS
jgi:stalled ribosome rescue protein Dom34